MEKAPKTSTALSITPPLHSDLDRAQEVATLQEYRDNLRTRMEELTQAMQLVQAQMDQVNARVRDLDLFINDEDAIVSLPPNFEDFLTSQSYSSDKDWDHSDTTKTDTDRLNRFDQRSSALGDIAYATGALSRAAQLEMQYAQKIDELDADLERFAQSVWPNFFGRRTTTLRDREMIEEKLQENAAAATELEAKKVDAEQRVKTLGGFRPYDASLHDNASVESLSDRSQQTVVLSAEKLNDAYSEYYLFTLYIPEGPDEMDYRTKLSLELHGQYIEDFCKLIGADLRLPNDNAHYENFDTITTMRWNIAEKDNALVPFALEIVTTEDGQRHYRIPQAVWERFGVCKV